MICETCQGKGIVLSRARWEPQPWDGSERRKDLRDEDGGEKFQEVPAPFYATCDTCDGLGRTIPGLLSHH
jgi:hypothetical protein